MKALFFSIFLLVSGFVQAQCPDKIEIHSGTLLINGINVTVTPTSTYSSISTSCNSASPYYIGTQIGSGISGYKFDFNPPTNAVTLNFAGLDNLGSNVEEVQIYVNSSHYPVPSVGTANECGSVATITASGNLRACVGCTSQGWNGTTIQGPISTITVSDQTISGNTGGSLFSIFICEAALNANQILPNPEIIVSPNPAKDFLSIRLPKNDNPFSFILFNSLGQKIITGKECSPIETNVNVESVLSGIYYLEITTGNNVTSVQKIIITHF